MIKWVQNGEESSLTIANLLCEELKIEKRHNRRTIMNILNKIVPQLELK